jgi:DNA-binding LacI/PurR family transcriptional regulator
MKTNPIRWEGRGAAELESLLRRLLDGASLELESPLPTTRDLARRFGIANTTAYRVLLKLRMEGRLWRHENGRFFPAGARELLEKPRPFACLLRRLETWSTMYEGVMAGFSQVCGQNHRGMLFIHNESLVQHSDLLHPPSFAAPELQKRALKEFVRHHVTASGGVLLDNAWNDAVLGEFADGLRNGVVVCRPTSLPFLSSVHTDYQKVALMAIGHLLARGYREIWLAVPFRNDATVDLVIEHSTAAARELGLSIDPRNILSAGTPPEQARLVRRLKTAAGRVGLFCPEDNVTRILYDRISAAGLACPKKIGLLSGFGTLPVRERGITSVECDFEEIGRQAAAVLNDSRLQRVMLPPRLLTGKTT